MISATIEEFSMKIMVADDSETTRKLLTESLTRLGHEVTAVSNGQQVLELFQTKRLRPDLIILDVIMEGLDGFECAKSIRAMSPDDWIPIIFLSGAVDDENIARGINAGGDDYLTKPYSEITLLAKIKSMQRIANMRRKLFETTKQLHLLSSTDGLTHIFNRLQFDKTIKEKVASAYHSRQKLALLFLDLDHFKSVNDNFGHAIGDLLLKEVAKRLQSYLSGDDFLARIGGDEFAIILSNIKNKEAAEIVAEKIIKGLEEPYRLEGNQVHISTSVGIAFYQSDNKDAEDLMKMADAAMYHVKELGGNNFKVFVGKLKTKYTKALDEHTND